MVQIICRTGLFIVNVENDYSDVNTSEHSFTSTFTKSTSGKGSRDVCILTGLHIIVVLSSGDASCIFM